VSLENNTPIPINFGNKTALSYSNLLMMAGHGEAWIMTPIRHCVTGTGSDILPADSRNDHEPRTSLLGLGCGCKV
jgi:hypothetical protein